MNSEVIFYGMAIIGMILGIFSGAYILLSAIKFKHDVMIKTFLFILGITNTLAAFAYALAVFGIDGFAQVSNFSKVMRSITLIYEILPTLIAYRMRGI